MDITDVDMGRLVLTSAIHNKHYASKVVPFLEAGYFADETESAIAETIVDFFSKYSKTPSNEEVVVEMRERPDINRLDRNVLRDTLKGDAYSATDTDWLIEKTEKFIRRRRVSAAFEATYSRFDNGDDIEDASHIFQQAMAFTFDSSLGHSYVMDSETRYEYYTCTDNKKSLMIAMMDKVTSGGVGRGTLNCYLAGTGVGKSLVMCDQAAKAAMAGSKVLYISLEMAEMRLAERIDANLMDVDIGKLKHMTEEEYNNKMRVAVQKMSLSGGDIIFKQYPTSSAHAGHFRALLIEAKNKGIEFDYVFIDYLNICASMRGKSGDNSYTLIKCIAEELRALAVEFDIPIITATQTNRTGQNATDLDFEDVSESHGLAATVDMLFGLIASEEMQAMGRMMVRQIKNRYGDKNYFKRFPVGVERSKMRLYDLREEASVAMSSTEAAKANPNAKSAISEMQGKDKPQSNKLDFSVLGKTNDQL